MSRSETARPRVASLAIVALSRAGWPRPAAGIETPQAQDLKLGRERAILGSPQEKVTKFAHKTGLAMLVRTPAGQMRVPPCAC